MLTVHILAQPGIMGAASSVLAGLPELGLGLRTNNIREALGYGYASTDLLVIDDGLLSESPGLVATLSETLCRKILVGSMADAAAGRRALVLGVVTMIDWERLSDELPEAVSSLVPALARQEPWVAAVYSAKGGVGKSTAALNLAWALALQSERDVALVDCDPLGDIGAMIQDKPGATLADLVRGLHGRMGEDKLLQSLYHVKALGLTVVPAGANPQDVGSMSPEDFEKVISILKEHHSYVVLDLPTGLTDTNLVALDVANQIVVMSAPERVTLTAVSRALDILRRLYPQKLALLLNRADSDTGLSQAEVETVLGQPLHYILPSGGSGPVRAANKGRPLMLAEPKNPLARAIAGMAREIVGGREGARRRPRRWFAR